MRKSKKILGQKKPSRAAAIWSVLVISEELGRKGKRRRVREAYILRRRV